MTTPADWPLAPLRALLRDIRRQHPDPDPRPRDVMRRRIWTRYAGLYVGDTSDRIGIYADGGAW